jgi:hypothetical protein
MPNKVQLAIGRIGRSQPSPSFGYPPHPAVETNLEHVVAGFESSPRVPIGHEGEPVPLGMPGGHTFVELTIGETPGFLESEGIYQPELTETIVKPPPVVEPVRESGDSLRPATSLFF